MKNQIAKKVKHKRDFKGILSVNIRAMKSLFKMLNASYWQSISGPVMSFVFPMFFVGMYGYIMKAQYASYADQSEGLLKSALVGIIAMMGMSFAVNAVPQWINDFKTSVLLKRIGITPIKPVTFILTVSFYAVINMVVQFAWILMWIAIWFAADLIKILNAPIYDQNGIAYNGGQILWGQFTLSIVYQIFTAICIGLFIVSISKSALTSNVIAMIIFFLSQFLSGMVFPIQLITQTPTLNILSHLTPFRYTSGNITMAWDGANPFNWSSDFWISMGGKGIMVYPVYDIVLNNFMPIVFIALAIFTSTKNFKWNAR